MRDEIIQKLHTKLESGLQSESDVTYLLVMIRKYLERAKHEGVQITGSYDYLKFYCDWVAHPKLSWSRIIPKIFDSLSKIHLKLLEGGKYYDLDQYTQTQVDNITGMKIFRSELEQFLEEHNLPQLNPNRGEGWVKFLHFYSQIISDCPLFIENTSDANHLLKMVQVRCEVASKLIHEERLYRIIWIMVDKDDKGTDFFLMNSFSETRL